MPSAAYMREWRKTHPRTAEQKLRHNAYNREWEKANKERIAEQRKAIYDAKTPQQRVLYRQRRNEKLRNLIWDIKLASGCVDCGYKANPVALQFDHLPQFKKNFGIGARLVSIGKAALLEEIKKCVVRCANCHAIKSYQRQKGVH